jgi:UDP-N-acetylmuramate dehydrogenase
MKPVEQVSLSERTTLCVGGPARFWFDAADALQVVAALAWADERGVPLDVLGGGSNVLAADRGVDGLVLRVRDAAIDCEREGDDALIDVGAGMEWDALVAWSVARGYAGLECMSGIPGDVGAAPMQNVGAYGQEVSDTLEAVHAIDRRSGAAVTLAAEQCRFGYRDSAFKGALSGRYVVVGARFRLRVGGAPTIAYAELAGAVGASGAAPSVASVRDTVIALRRRKSMVLDASDDNHRSAGSFFVNPVVDAALADQLASSDETMPRYPAGDGRTKLAAAWLIEKAGMAKGTRRGQVGISSRHSLAIVNHGGATAADIVAFAIEVRRRVRERFGVTLQPEPRPLGFLPHEIEALYAV